MLFEKYCYFYPNNSYVHITATYGMLQGSTTQEDDTQCFLTEKYCANKTN